MSVIVRALLLATCLCCSASLAWGDKLNVTGGVLFNFSCGAPAPAVLMYFSDIKYVQFNSSENVSLSANGQPVETVVGCNKTTNTLSGVSAVASIKVPLPSSQKELTFDFHFKRTNGRLSAREASSEITSFYWELITIALRTDGNKSMCFIPQDENDWVIAPRNFSFSCQPQRTWVPLNISRSWRSRQNLGILNGTCADVASKAMLNVSGLQVQVFDFISADAVRFDFAIDCVGYINGPLAMGFIVAFLLFSILFLVSCIFLGMETPSRFDDPKGKNICT